jgi:hypothetical protein
LIETFDAWEPWDTLHQVPGKLRWAMWAFSHAAVLDRNGAPRVPEGSYISWANQRTGNLLSEADVTFVRDNLDAAQASAAQLEAVHGPTAVYHRSMMEWLSQHHPDWNVSEWIDEQAGFIMKWGVPILSATRSEWLDQVRPEAMMLQTLGQLADDAHSSVLNLLATTPALIIGRADVIDPEILKLAGAEINGDLQAKGYVRASPDASVLKDDVPEFNILHLPAHQPIAAAGEVLFHTQVTPTLVRKSKVIYWQPPDWSEPANAFLPRYQVGSLASHALAARALMDASRSIGCSRIEQVPFAQPVTFHLWRSAGKIHVLLGNLETGLTGDARLERRVTLILNRQQLKLTAAGYQLHEIDGDIVSATRSTADEICFEVRVPPESSLVYAVELSTEGPAHV